MVTLNGGLLFASKFQQSIHSVLQEAQLPQRDSVTHHMSVKILSTAAQLYEKKHYIWKGLQSTLSEFPHLKRLAEGE